MADFSTELSPAQHAGANVVNPVQVQPAPNFDINPFIEKGLNIFAKLGEDAAKRKADEMSNAVVQQYLEQENAIADQHRVGNIDASKAGTLSRANYQKFIASNPGLIKNLAEARKSVYEGTETGAIVDEVKQQQERDKIADATATSKGFDMSENMSPETRNARHQAAAAMVRSEELQKKLTAEQSYRNASNAEERTAVEFKQKQDDRAKAAQASSVMQEVVSTNYSAFSSSILDKVTAATTPEAVQQVELYIASELSRYQAFAANATGGSKELMSAYLTPFQTLAETAKASLKSGVKLDSLKQKVQEMEATAQLAFYSRPNVLATVMASKLTPQAPETLTRASNVVVENLAVVSKALNETPLYKLPTIVGGEGEKATYDALTEVVQRMNNGKISGDEVKTVSTEFSNALNVVMKQTEAMAKSDNANPADLGKVMEFYAKDEFGQASKAGMLPPGAKKGVFNALTVYSEAVVTRITQDLSEKAQNTGQRASASVADYIGDIKFEGGKLVLYPSQNFGTEAGRGAAKETLNKSEAALTRLVRVGAHLEGTTDYGKWWEANRHTIMPTVYADPERFPAGFVNPNTGYKFKGGMFYNANNWEKPSNGPK